MKKILSTLSILSVLLLFNACSNDEGPFISLDGKDYWSFQSATQNFIATEEGKTIVYLPNISETSAVTPVNVTVNFGAGVEELFTIENLLNGTIDGEDVSYLSFTSVDNLGRAVIEITYDVEDLSYNRPYTIVFSIPEQPDYPIANSLITTLSVSIVRPLDFNNLGNGTFISVAFDEEWEQPVLLGVQAVVYRLPNLYSNGRAIDIVDNEDGTVTIASQPAWLSLDYGVVYVRGTGEKEGNTITMDIEHYVPGLGTFGSFDEVLILPE